MGNGTQQDPTQAAFSDAAQVPDVPKSKFEKAMGLVGGLTVGHRQGSQLDAAIEKHHQQRLDEARMHRRTAASALSIWSYGTDPKTGNKLTPQQEQQYLNEWNSAMELYQKVAGVNKETKAAIQKSKQLAEYTAQQQRQKRQGPGQYPMNVGEGGVTPNPDAQGPPPPPPTPGQQPSPASAPPAGPAGGPPPPVPFAAEAPFLKEQAQDRIGRQRALDDNAAAFEQRRQNVEKIGGDKTSLAMQEYVLTGKMSAGATRVGKFTQGPYMTDPDGVPRKVLLSPEGQYVDPVTHQPVGDDWKFISASDLATKTAQLMNPDGTPETVFRKGDYLYDNEGNKIEGKLTPFVRGMLPSVSDREVAVYDPDTHQFKKMIFRTTRKTPIPGIGSTPAASPAGAGGPPAPPGADGAGAAPRPSAGPQGTPQAGGKSGGRFIPGAQMNQLRKSAVPISEARNALIGDEPGKVGGLAADLHIFKSPESVKRISEYLGLINKQVEDEGRAVVGQGPLAAAEWYLNLPQTVIGLQQGALRDASKTLTPDEQKFIADYYRVMGTIGGMRAATGMSAARWSYNTLRAELPTPGPVTDFKEAQRRVLNYVKETNVAAQDNPLATKVDTADTERQIKGGTSDTMDLKPPGPAKPGMKWQHRTANGKVEWRQVAATK